VSRRPSAVRRIGPRARRAAGGAFLLEALVALLIFSLGVLAIAGLHGRVTRLGSDAQYRAEAAHLAHAVLAEMRATYPGPAFASFDSDVAGEGYRTLREKAKRLPGAFDDAIAPTVRIDGGPSERSRRVDVVLSWRAPGDTTVHRYAAGTVIGAN
jgi:type IV pilus assembly protein PilV